MPDKNKSSFVWYHAKLTDEPKIRAWLDVVKKTFAVSIGLYVRKDVKHVTFMEVFSDISIETGLAIETLSTEYALFKHINRRSETFEEVFKDAEN